VMIPGSAIGSTKRNETESRPKKRVRARPNARASRGRARPRSRAGRPGTRARARSHLLVVPRLREPLRREAGDRPALDVRRVERVDAHDRERDPEPEEDQPGPDPQPRPVSRAVSSERLERPRGASSRRGSPP
jgi:hypothetical protein